MDIPSINSLNSVKSLRDNSKIEIYTMILNKCIQKILFTNKNTEQTFIIFEVPKLLIGYPIYNIKSCILFLIDKLSNNGYKIDFIDPFYLYIDWGITKSSNNLFKIKNELLSKYPNTLFEIEYEDKDNPKKKSKKSKKKIN